VTNTLRKQLRYKLIEPLFIVRHVRAKDFKYWKLRHRPIVREKLVKQLTKVLKRNRRNVLTSNKQQLKEKLTRHFKKIEYLK